MLKIGGFFYVMIAGWVNRSRIGKLYNKFKKQEHSTYIESYKQQSTSKPN